MKNWIGVVAIVVTVGHGSLGAQDRTPVSDVPQAVRDRNQVVLEVTAPRPFSRQAIAGEVARQFQTAPPVAPQKSGKKPMSRGTKAAIGALLAGSIGALIGSSLEDDMDIPEGTGALLFGGIGAGAGALIGWSFEP